MNFKDYKTNARYAEQINAGYSARLNGEKANPFLAGSEDAYAFFHGWQMADRHEDKDD